jgi:hypothetical protein
MRMCSYCHKSISPQEEHYTTKDKQKFYHDYCVLRMWSERHPSMNILSDEEE